MKYYIDNINYDVLYISLSGQSVPPNSFVEIDHELFELIEDNLSNTLDQIKITFANYLDKLSGDVRSKYVTTIPGQAEVYIKKAEEAEKIAGLPYEVNPADYPLIATEMAIQGTDLTTTVQNILAIQVQWLQLAAAVEFIRLTGKKAINNATTITDVLSNTLNSSSSLKQL